MAKDEDILNLLSNIRNEQRDARAENTKAFSDLDKKVDLHIQKTEYELKRIHDMDAMQNKLLDQHIEGVNTLRNIHQEHVRENNFRFSKLEEPRKALKTLTSFFIWFGGIGTATVGVLKLIEWFTRGQ